MVSLKELFKAWLFSNRKWIGDQGFIADGTERTQTVPVTNRTWQTFVFPDDGVISTNPMFDSKTSDHKIMSNLRLHIFRTQNRIESDVDHDSSCWWENSGGHFYGRKGESVEMFFILKNPTDSVFFTPTIGSS